MTLTREHISSIRDEAQDELAGGHSGMWIATANVIALCDLALSALSVRARSSMTQDMDDQDGSDAVKALAQPDGLSWNELKQKHGLESPSPPLSGRVAEVVKRLRDYGDISARECLEAADLLAETERALAEADAAVASIYFIYGNGLIYLRSQQPPTENIRPALERHTARAKEGSTDDK